MTEAIFEESQALCRAIEQLPATEQQAIVWRQAFVLAQSLKGMSPGAGDASDSRSAAFNAISSERDHQDRKWRTLTENPHELGTWLMLMGVHLRRAQEVLANTNHDAGAPEALRKVLAIGTVCAEQHGRPVRPPQQTATAAPPPLRLIPPSGQ